MQWFSGAKEGKQRFCHTPRLTCSPGTLPSTHLYQAGQWMAFARGPTSGKFQRPRGEADDEDTAWRSSWHCKASARTREWVSLGCRVNRHVNDTAVCWFPVQKLVRLSRDLWMFQEGLDCQGLWGPWDHQKDNSRSSLGDPNPLVRHWCCLGGSYQQTNGGTAREGLQKAPSLQRAKFQRRGNRASWLSCFENDMLRKDSVLRFKQF